MYRYGEKEVKAVQEVLRSGQWFRYGDPETGHTQQAASFEKEWTAAFGVKHAGLVSSGTAALMCCYAGLQIGPGDEVIVPGYTWIASATAPLTRPYPKSMGIANEHECTQISNTLKDRT